MQGLWAFERSLIVDPNTVVFPLACLFTGDPVSETTVMTLAQVEASNLGMFTSMKKRETQLSIPVSLRYRRGRAVWSKKVRKALVIFGSILAISGVVIPLSMGLEGDALGSTVCCVIAFAVLSLIVGFCFPYLDDMNGSKYISGVRFLKDGRIVIPKIHKKVLVGLPELQRGFMDGFLGAESLKPKREG